MRRGRYIGQVIVLAAVYYLVAHYSVALASLKGNVSAVWPPAGIAIAALVLGGRKFWPAVFIGEFAANGIGSLPVLVALGMAAGNSLEAVVAATLVRRRRDADLSFSRNADLLKWVGLAIPAGTLISASIGVTSLYLGGIVPAAGLIHVWLVWWVGDILGALILGTTLLVWLPRRHEHRSWNAEVVLGFAGLIVSTLFAFSTSVGFPYLVFPFVVWAAIRYTQRGAATAMLVVSTIAVVRTADGQGTFIMHGSVNYELWTLDFFLGIVALTALLLAAVVTERDAARLRLALANQGLEARVIERTQALRIERERFAEAQRVGHIGSWDWDIATNAIVWSEELYRLFGLDASTLVASYEGYLAALHPDDRGLVDMQVKNALRTHEPYAVRHRVITPAGEVRWIRGRGQVFLDEAGAPTRLSGTAQDISEAAELEAALAHQALHDSLTGLPNRVLFTDRLDVALRRSLRDDHSVAVMFLDLDRFKWVNDSLGHDAGDRVLRIVADRLTTHLRPGDTVARFGGDEFVVLCDRVDDPGDLAELATRLLGALAEPIALEDLEIPVAASLGIALAGQGHTAAELVRDADAAMYRAKERGGARAELFDAELREAVDLRFATASALRLAIEQGGMQAHYQPIISLATGDVVGVEALARWLHPVRGLLAPAQFIAVAEQTGLIVSLGEAMLRTACHDIAAWNRAHPALPPMYVAVNVSARQLAVAGLADAVAGCLLATQLPASHLHLEITESALMDDAEATRECIDGLHRLGVHLSVDDFGTGYSSLLYLRQFPVSTLKIDRSFVDGLGRESDDTAIVTGVVHLAHALGLTAVAEGVETGEQLELLKHHGCELAQGYWWSPPLSMPDLAAWLAEFWTSRGPAPAYDARPSAQIMPIPAQAGSAESAGRRAVV